MTIETVLRAFAEARKQAKEKAGSERRGRPGTPEPGGHAAPIEAKRNERPLAGRTGKKDPPKLIV